MIWNCYENFGFFLRFKFLFFKLLDDNELVFLVKFKILGFVFGNVFLCWLKDDFILIEDIWFFCKELDKWCKVFILFMFWFVFFFNFRDLGKIEFFGFKEGGWWFKRECILIILFVGFDIVWLCSSECILIMWWCFRVDILFFIGFIMFLMDCCWVVFVFFVWDLVVDFKVIWFFLIFNEFELFEGGCCVVLSFMFCWFNERFWILEKMFVLVMFIVGFFCVCLIVFFVVLVILRGLVSWFLVGFLMVNFLGFEVVLISFSKVFFVSLFDLFKILVFVVKFMGLVKLLVFGVIGGSGFVIGFIISCLKIFKRFVFDVEFSGVVMGLIGFVFLSLIIDEFVLYMLDVKGFRFLGFVVLIVFMKVWGLLWLVLCFFNFFLIIFVVFLLIMIIDVWVNFVFWGIIDVLVIFNFLIFLIL